MTTPEIIERISVLITMLEEGDYEHRPLPEFLELLEDGEKFVQDMRDLVNGK